MGELAKVKARFENHEREDCWETHCGGTIVYAVYYTPYKEQSGRMETEQDLLEQYNPLCGKR